ncbi:MULTISPECIES: bifunctional enoyl-CoA hydratase/phosphate acetyltransferase [Halomonadaceae]|uniref:Phosphate acetyl/butaryl transferase domain-containing protein n=1 Tax=Modicisalibacter zincidurans TaxID=1178777 RepID=A0ABP9RJZ6_9GAMM|nr:MULTISPECIES: bifunctional enoyl-CoA hydratase/phosphate acetyltransferase [Halomonas]MCD6007054.1 bifunctional enoyl-CoA hydratase/phosphate acetyltransferase [Halomonas sp. IOP_31]
MAAQDTLPHDHPVGDRHRQLIDATRGYPPIRTAVVHPCDELSLGGALAAWRQGVIEPLLVGPRARIEATAEKLDADLDELRIVDTPHSHASAEAAVRIAASGEARALMKGALHTDELMSVVLAREAGLRSERQMSHIYALDVASYPRPLLITDGALHIQPDLSAKRDIVQNAIDLAHALGLERPRVAILSAVETVNPRIPSTLDAAALCKMSQRSQIAGGDLDGPLAIDNAVSVAAARAKGLDSAVAGRADVLVAPDLEAANMIAKLLIHLAGAQAAGLVMGAQVPIMLTSRSDDIATRLASAALACLVVLHSDSQP